MRWFNLGAWDEAASYPEACRDLALRLGRATGLRAGHRVFDAGCGGGGQLEVWLDEFGVGEIDAVDSSRRAAAAARRLLAGHRRAGSVRIRRARVPAGLDGRGYDRVLALDAAYHFDTRRSFLDRARRALTGRGRLALTDLVLTDRGQRELTGFRRAAIGRLLGIPGPNAVTVEGYARDLAAAGFSADIEPLTESVLSGYVAYVERGDYRRDFPLRLWPMVAGTAGLLGRACDRGWVGYVLVDARLGRTSSGAPARPLTGRGT